MITRTKDDIEALELMQQCGGHFVSNLARAWVFADAENDLRLRLAFGHYLDEYKALAQKAKNRTSAPAHDPTRGGGIEGGT